MEQQRTLNFQIPYKVSSESSIKSSFAVPNSFYMAEQVLLGSLLGDGHIKRDKYKSIFIEAHSIKQKEYLKWKTIILNSFFKIRLVERLDKKGYVCIWLRTLHYRELNQYHSLFYPNGKKIVTREILDKLEPLGLAVWYCDDGNYNYVSNTINIATQSFSYEEHLTIKEWFIKKYYLNSTFIKDGDKYRLNLNAIYTKRLIKLIKPYVPECMSYKLGIDKQKIDIGKIYRKNYYLNNKQKLLDYQKVYQKIRYKIKRGVTNEHTRTKPAICGSSK